MKRKILSIVLVLPLLNSCNKSSEVGALQEEIAQLHKDIEELSSRSTDRNGDGVEDAFYEMQDGFVFELLDTDFDGRVDESWRYDENDNLLSGKVDEDGNGIPETEYFYENAVLSKVLADSDGNLIYDVFTKLNPDATAYSEKYYPSTPEQPRARIGRVDYRFGHPIAQEVIAESLVSETEFSESRL